MTDQVGDADRLSLRTMMFPRDLNPAGNIFGGTIMSLMDEAAAIHSRDYPGRFVTRHVSEIDFPIPVNSGDEILGYTRTVQEGQTSVSIQVLLMKRPRNHKDLVYVAKGTFVMVCVDDSGQKRRWNRASER